MKEENKKSNNNSTPLSFMKEPERQKILLGIKNILSNNKKIEKESSINLADYAQRKPSDYSFLKDLISKELIPRAVRIRDNIFKIITELGGKINPDLTIEIRGERIGIHISEMQSLVLHTQSKDEEKRLNTYKARLGDDECIFKPRIRKYDYKFNGRLRISPRENVYYRDSASKNGNKIEDKLENIIIDLYEESEVIRLNKIKKHRQKSLDRKARRRNELKRHSTKKELNRIKSLENEASDFDMACKIRRYIAGVEASNPSLKTKEWIEWAKKKADWYDPTIKNKDSHFGFRNSWKASEKKVPNKDPLRYY